MLTRCRRDTLHADKVLCCSADLPFPPFCRLSQQVRCQAGGVPVNAVLKQLTGPGSNPTGVLRQLYAGVVSASLASVVVGECTYTLPCKGALVLSWLHGTIGYISSRCFQMLLGISLYTVHVGHEF